MSGRAEIVHAMQVLAAEWRGRSMSLDAQIEFDIAARRLADLDAAEAALELAARQEPAQEPLAAKFTRHRTIRSAADYSAALADRSELLSQWRARTMPVEAQRAFDALTWEIDAYDRRQGERAAAPPDPRDAVLHAMRARVQGVPGW